jgi:hypothetical protein
MIDKESLQAEMMIEHLILQNAIEIDGVDSDTGEMIYSITDKLKEVNPQLYSGLKKDFEQHMFTLIDQGPKVMKWKLNNGF